MTDSHTISGAIVKRWFNALAKGGIPVQRLEEETGLTLDQLEDLDSRISLDQHYKLMETGIALTGNPALALQMGEFFEPEDLGIVGHVFVNSPTLREAGQQAVRYTKLICEVAYLDLQEQDDYALLVHRIEDEKYNFSVAAEISLSSAITMMRLFSRSPFNPIEVRFRHAAPEHVAEYQRIFQSPILFDRPENGILFEKKYLDCQHPAHNSYLQEVLTKHADSLLSQLTAGKSLQDQVRKYIFDQLPTGEVDIEMVALHLNMSRWTLTRKLKEEGTSFQELFKQMRKKLAMNYLQKKKFSISEVAFLLGFSEPSAFHRAFKSWVGKSPGEYRNSALSVSTVS